jgi:hypothetical protein
MDIIEIPHGLMLIGRYAGLFPVEYGKLHAKAGQPVPGLHRFTLTCELRSGAVVEKSATVSEVDRETDEPSPGWTQIQAAQIPMYALVAVKVKVTVRKGSDFPNVDLLRVYDLSLEHLPAFAAAASFDDEAA